MISPVETGELFVCFLVTLGYVPVLRAYATRRESPWLVAGYSALLVGRAAAVAEHLAWPTAMNLVEHGVGVALAATLFVIHFYGEWQTGDGGDGPGASAGAPSETAPDAAGSADGLDARDVRGGDVEVPGGPERSERRPSEGWR